MLTETEPHFDANLFPERAERCKKFKGKRVSNDALDFIIPWSESFVIANTVSAAILGLN